MRWSIIRLIWLRDLRDQLRDRRTVVMIALLPLVLYPALGLGVMQFALTFVEKPSTIGIVCEGGDFPPHAPRDGSTSPVPAAAWLALTPPGPGAPGVRIDRVLGAAALARLDQHYLDYPLLVKDGRFPKALVGGPDGGGAADKWVAPLRVVYLAGDDRAPLDAKEVDLIVSAPKNFWARLDLPGSFAPYLKIQGRPDERSRQASNRLYLVLVRWKRHLKEVRLVRRGLPAGYDDPVEIHDERKDRPASALASEGVFDLLVKIFPFMLVMWALAGALYPAVDLCAGEKERGTMETLIISPASRVEIVLGKFLTIWVFSAGTSLLNLISMGVTAWQFGSQFPGETLKASGLVWCVVLLVPLSAFFSAVCLSVGAYARSSKEGQYYLMPLFLVTMPLIFLTLAPGVELNPFYSLVPVTGVALLMQRLMGAVPAAADTWLYFAAVLAPLVLYSALSLRWAIEQFKREEVLFREAERLDIGLWLRRLFRDREALPSAGQAWFCFALIMALRWLALGLGGRLAPLVHLAVVLLAFVGTPAVLMALQLTTRPRQALALNRVGPGWLVTALMLGSVVLIPLVQLTLFLFERLDRIREMVREHEGMVRVFQELRLGEGSGWLAVLSLVVLPAVCEELAFRGFILTGLRRRYRPWAAIGLSSFLFALYHMNVFQLLPTFLLGVVLALLTVRSGSVVPAMVLHLLHNGLLVGGACLQQYVREVSVTPETVLFIRLTVTGLCALLAGLLLWRLALGSPLPAVEGGRPSSPSGL
jgi:sodium transport system permease protein